MATYWISKTHVRIEPSEMTREEALALAKELLDDLSASRRGRHGQVYWTPEMDEELRNLRAQNLPIREIAIRMLGDMSKVGAVSGRIKRLGLPTSEIARKRGLASLAARRA